MLKLDLQFFGEDDVDIEAELAAFEAEWTDEEVQEDPTEEVEEAEAEEVEENPEEEVDTELEEAEEVETEEEPPAEDDRRNRAFADLRRQAEENKKYADFIQRMANDSGVKPEDILARYEQMTLQQQSEREGVPVEYLQRQNQTESELAQLREQLVVERLDKQIQDVIGRYSATNEDIQATFEEMYRMGVDPNQNMNVDFEKFYRAANHEKIVQAEVEKARQTDLSAKKKRQEQAAIPNGSSVPPTNGDGLSDEEFESILAKMDLNI